MNRSNYRTRGGPTDARASLSVACLVILRISTVLERFGVRRALAVSLSVVALAELPLLCGVPAVLVGRFGSAFNTLLPALWPSMSVLLCTAFALLATRHLIDSETLAKSLLADDQSLDFARNWRAYYSSARQITVATVMGLTSAIGSFLIVRALHEPPLFCLLCAISMLFAGTVGGLAFYIGVFCWSLTHVLAKYECRLHRFVPASTSEITEIAASSSKIMMLGVVVGAVLSVPLLGWASIHVEIGEFQLLRIGVLCAWVVIVLVFVAIHYDLSRTLTRGQATTRKELAPLIESGYRTLGSADESHLKRLKELLDLDRSVYESPRTALGRMKTAVHLIGLLSLAAFPVVVKPLVDILMSR